jgi:nucleobase transporter 1/2
LCILLGMQTYLTMLGATVLIPSILVPAMGGTTKDLAEVINTCFITYGAAARSKGCFRSMPWLQVPNQPPLPPNRSSGINTLIQTLLGARLPIVQGGSFAYLAPVLTIAAGIQNSQTFDSDHDRFLVGSSRQPLHAAAYTARQGLPL